MRSHLLTLRSQLRLATLRPASRSFATTVKDTTPLEPCVDSDNCTFKEPTTDGRPATLHFKSGHVFTGRSFGAPVSTFGEAVFTTSTTSYPESMTDPSYRSQILVFTTPMIGNYGVPPNILATSPTPVPFSPDLFLESDRVQCSGVVVAELADRFSHYQAMESISNWCHRFGVPGITGVDTRAITSLLRQQGSSLAKIAVGDGHQTPSHPNNTGIRVESIWWLRLLPKQLIPSTPPVRSRSPCSILGLKPTLPVHWSNMVPQSPSSHGILPLQKSSANTMVSS
ncbi:hypothetical protein Pst134EA_023010 [Puccinia striiformis f. sp. tritici]|uniref:hypothetical protein n=1 Tax=Puccinia striiformis f. sp. tritici TaxID=168172 RepID=UPI0020076F15|nr:hypothetical protein Pst134EA_023010 [Puccinia striiformis f. sp. tritici]KAH9455551.1 hypothetical protein Pst134EA_023010 [Puccinia striiformis f. sp. tritici]